ncbi:CLUMA_CG016871, isoform A [Clunio marinus]|uniref:CLUMA_CG016871, isoform A n=1 Tax=Clunio marinus TaxID=568069 RepID=A0A1J1IZ18_9DIPT|nr:CLUMA_CG016871, isoform A [Clunio marinus]
MEKVQPQCYRLSEIKVEKLLVKKIRKLDNTLDVIYKNVFCALKFSNKAEKEATIFPETWQSPQGRIIVSLEIVRKSSYHKFLVVNDQRS